MLFDTFHCWQNYEWSICFFSSLFIQIQQTSLKIDIPTHLTIVIVPMWTVSVPSFDAIGFEFINFIPFNVYSDLKWATDNKREIFELLDWNSPWKTVWIKIFMTFALKCVSRFTFFTLSTVDVGRNIRVALWAISIFTLNDSFSYPILPITSSTYE